jgi:isopenicillin-N epimerase
VPLNIDALDCDFYLASCHKWMAATLGSGFLYVHPRQQASFRPLVRSWGRLLPALPARWDEEFTWSGTRDPSIYLSVPAAITFLESVGLDSFRERLYWLARYAQDRLTDLFSTEPLGRSVEYRWYGTMAHVPLPLGDWSTLQARLWTEFGIEVPVIEFGGAWYVRVSCYLYNSTAHIDTLCDALQRLVLRS